MNGGPKSVLILSSPGAQKIPSALKSNAFGRTTMKLLLTSTMFGASLLIASTGMALATNVHTVTGTTGQHNQTIGTPKTASVTPADASTAPGSAFNLYANARTD